MKDCKYIYKGVKYDDINQIIEIIKTENFGNPFDNQELGSIRQVDARKQKEIQYSLKAVNILQSDKAKQVFAKGKKNNWDLKKILTELQVPKEQKQIILDKNIINREEIITSLLADNSFTVEINTSKTDLPKGYSQQEYEQAIYDEFRETDYLAGETDDDIAEVPEATEEISTQYYSNLTVPGGTNYTERNFETPLIKVPKSHAQFNTENTIGFTRGDDRIQYSESDIETLISTMEKSRILKIKCD